MNRTSPRIWNFMLSVTGLFASVTLGGFGCSADAKTRSATVDASRTLHHEDLTNAANGVAPADTLLSMETSREMARRQEIQYQFDSALKEAEHFTVTIANIAKPLNDTAVVDVHRSLSKGEVARNFDPALFTADELSAYDTRLARAKVAAAEAIERRQEWELQQRNQAAYDCIINEQRQQELERRRTVDDLTDQLKGLLG